MIIARFIIGFFLSLKIQKNDFKKKWSLILWRFVSKKIRESGLKIDWIDSRFQLIDLKKFPIDISE